MDFQKIINYLKRNFLWVRLYKPEEITKSLENAVKNQTETTIKGADLIAKEIKNKKDLNPKEITDPIISAHNESTNKVVDAIASIPKDDFTPLVDKMQEFISILDRKDLSVTIGETKVNVDTKSIVDAVKHLEKNIPAPDKISDYTEFFRRIIDVISRPIDKKIFEEIKEIAKKTATSDDIKEHIKSISKLQKNEQKLKLDASGRLPVSVDRISEVNGGLNNIESAKLLTLATEDKQDATAAYSISDLDDTSATKYYGFLKKGGGWYIMSYDGSAFRYVKGDSGYNWSNRASESYDIASNVF